MKMKKTLLAASLAVAMGGSVTQVNADGVIQVGDAGRVALAPLYIAEPGYTTKITVTNPHAFAVKAKIVFRSSCTSEEMMDFVLYLSPKDVWTGTLSHNGTTVVMSTSDDSSRIPSGTFNDQDPRTGANAVPFFNSKLGTGNAVCASTDAHTLGHFEVTAAYAVAAGFYRTPSATTTAADVQVKQGMSKSDLFKIMADTGSITTATTAANIGGTTTDAGVANANSAKTVAETTTILTAAKATSTSGSVIPMRIMHRAQQSVGGTSYFTYNSGSAVAGGLTAVGEAQIDSDDSDTTGNAHNVRLITDVFITHPNGASAIYHAPALYNDPVVVESEGAVSATNRVAGLIDNSLYDAITGMDTRVGEYYRTNASASSAVGGAVPLFVGTTVNDTGAYDGIGDVENAIATTNLVTNYIEDTTTQTGIVVSFPTRYRHRIQVPNASSTASAAIGLATGNNINHDFNPNVNFSCSRGLTVATTGTINVGNYTAPFAANAQIPYTFTYTDTSENSPTSTGTTVSGSLAAGGNNFDFETQFFTMEPVTGYSEGQASVVLARSQACGAATEPTTGASTIQDDTDGDNVGDGNNTTADTFGGGTTSVPAVAVAVIYDPNFATATMARIFGAYDGI